MAQAVALLGSLKQLDEGQFGRTAAAAAELMAYDRLTGNWDGEGAATPPPDAVAEALMMLYATPPDLMAPKPMIMASGDIALYWDFGDRYAEIGFSGNGTYYAHGTAPGVELVHMDDVPLADSSGRIEFPAFIREILRAAA